MLRKSPLRVTLAFFLGFFGGVSLTSSIFPFVVSSTYGVPSFEILLRLEGFTIPLALLWAIGGGVLGWMGGPRVGGIVLGACGLLSGLVLSVVALGGSALLALLGGLTGVAYGGTAGLLLGKVFVGSEKAP